MADKPLTSHIMMINCKVIPNVGGNMRTHREMRLIVLVVLAAGTLLAFAGNGPRQSKSPEYDKRLLAVNTVRLINTAESRYHFNHGMYAEFAELAKSREIEELGGAFQSVYTKLDLQAGSEPLPGFELRIVVAGDGKSYKLSLAEKEGKCRWGLFSDDRGLIYHGKAIDCPID